MVGGCGWLRSLLINTKTFTVPTGWQHGQNPPILQLHAQVNRSAAAGALFEGVCTGEEEETHLMESPLDFWLASETHAKM